VTATRARDRYRRLVAGFPRVRAVVAGDLVADEFIYGRIDRVSREAPVLILHYGSTEIVPGGAGNAAANAAALGARVSVIGVLGRDSAGARLATALSAAMDTRGVVRASRYVTPVKTRILAGGVHSAKQQVVRIDRAGSAIAPAIGRRIEAALARAIATADVVVLSDYGSGLITPEVWRRASGAAGRVPPFVLVDSRYALGDYIGLTACTPNEPEVEALVDVRIDDRLDVLERAGRTLLDRLGCRAVLVTRGSRGMALFEHGRPTDHIPIVGSDEVADVTGAGDTVMAVFSLSLAAGASFGEAARLANYAGGLVVMKRGTATVTAAELLEAIDASSDEGPASRSVGRGVDARSRARVRSRKAAR
jgi:rfaE bifunctional protein kinase chain/domain